MRVAFIQVSAESRTEYDVHRLLAEEAKNMDIEAHFLNQSPNQESIKTCPEYYSILGQTYYYDYGRNMSIEPKPPRSKRALMMILRAPGGAAYILRKVKQLKPDVLYTSQQEYDMFFGRYSSSLLKIPHVVHIHYPVGYWLGASTLRGLKRASLCIAVSEYVRSGAIECGISPSKIHVLPNPVKNGSYLPRHKSGEMLNEFGWTEGNIIIISAGRLDPSKGHMLLIKAFPSVLKEFPRARLLICGSSTYRDDYKKYLKQKVEELGLQEFIVFAGYRNDLPKILASSDLFCLPTENEAFGLVFIEAMSAGLPIVALNSGSTPEIVRHGETGLLSEPGDVQALSRNLSMLINDTMMARQFGLAGQEYIKTHYLSRTVAEQWMQILSSRVEAR
jgi:glycosyltransferase involved in cell wall biosynthesis